MRIQPGQVALVHAAAGGLGQKLTQLITAHGGTAISIVSSEQKAETARASAPTTPRCPPATPSSIRSVR
nr:hypothetical protein [Streptomyces antimycoticus]